MKKDKIKNLLDLLPVIILAISAAALVWGVITADTFLMWKHILAICLLPIVFLAFRWRHRIGVLVLGLTLLLGLLGLLSYSHSVTISTYWIGIGDISIIVFYGQPIFLLWLLIHFIVSGRYYVGIATKKYWQNLLNPSMNDTAPVDR